MMFAIKSCAELKYDFYTIYEMVIQKQWMTYNKWEGEKEEEWGGGGEDL